MVIGGAVAVLANVAFAVKAILDIRAQVAWAEVGYVLMSLPAFIFNACFLVLAFLCFDQIDEVGVAGKYRVWAKVAVALFAISTAMTTAVAAWVYWGW